MIEAMCLWEDGGAAAMSRAEHGYQRTCLSRPLNALEGWDGLGLVLVRALVYDVNAYDIPDRNSQATSK